MNKKAEQTPTYTLPVVENWLYDIWNDIIMNRDKKNKFNKYQRRYVVIQNRIL